MNSPESPGDIKSRSGTRSGRSSLGRMSENHSFSTTSSPNMSRGSMHSDTSNGTRGGTDDASIGDSGDNFGNDYSNNYIHTGTLPQEHITNIDDPLVGYPKLQRLHELKKIHTLKYACKPFGCRVAPNAMQAQLEQWATAGLSFDIVMINGCGDTPASYDILANLPIQRITPRPSLSFLWVPSSQLEKGREVLEKWGFRRSEDIVYFTTSPKSRHFPRGLAVSPDEYLVKSTWHCLMGLKGSLRRSEDYDLINCNVDTDVILETTADRPNIVPEQIYSLVENFALMTRRLHIIPSYSSLDLPVRTRPGWVIMSPDVLLDNFDPRRYLESSRVKDFRAPVDREIDNLRPKTPTRMKK